MKRLIAMLLALVLVLSLVPGSVFAQEEILAAVAEEPAEEVLLPLTGETENTEEYIAGYASSYVYNWGSRGTVATEPSEYTYDFYTGSNIFENFMVMDGASSVSAVPSSELYKALKSFMSVKHDHETSYNETRELFRYTDCQNGGGQISAFYSGKLVGPDWDSGKTWNREHTWPNSKGDASGNGENDIIMLRPASSSTNSGRGNKAYGESSGYYDPNEASGGKYNLHGDVARIMLYVYVRWGNTGSMWGSGGVIESKEVLLKWAEEDPVDTWELGRNDAVQSITGTRNVFVDYPELVFRLFDEQVPANYQTPSGSTGSETPGAAATVSFQENGRTTDSVATQKGASITLPQPVNAVPAGWTFAGWVDQTVSQTTAKPSRVYAAGSVFTVPTGGTTLHALYSQQKEDTGGSNTTFELYTGPITEGDYLIVADGGAMRNSISKNRLEFTEVTVSEKKVDTEDASIIWHIAPTAAGEYWTIYNAETGKYAASNGSNNKAALNASGTDTKSQWTFTLKTDAYDIVNLYNETNGTNSHLRKNGTYGFATYSSGYGTWPKLYKRVGEVVTYTTGVASTPTHTPGDINGDGKTNNRDAVLLLQYLSDWEVSVVEAALDVNGDGKVNNRDAVLLLQYLSDWDVEIY